MKRTTIMLPESLKRKIAAKAKKMNISLGEFIRIASVNFLNREKKNLDQDPLANGDFVLDLKTQADISENIDKYVYGVSK